MPSSIHYSITPAKFEIFAIMPTPVYTLAFKHKVLEYIYEDPENPRKAQSAVEKFNSEGIMVKKQNFINGYVSGNFCCVDILFIRQSWMEVLTFLTNLMTFYLE